MTVSDFFQDAVMQQCPEKSEKPASAGKPTRASETPDKSDKQEPDPKRPRVDVPSMRNKCLADQQRDIDNLTKKLPAQWNYVCGFWSPSEPQIPVTCYG